LKTKREIEYQLKVCKRQYPKLIREGRDGLAQLVKGWIMALEWALEKEETSEE